MRCPGKVNDVDIFTAGKRLKVRKSGVTIDPGRSF
jgi:hypothetical protein